MCCEYDITKGALIPSQYRSNLETLIEKISLLEKAYGKSFKITSGFRTLAQHLRIYKEKGITDVKNIPMLSCHLFCQAVDVYDPDFALTEFCKENEALAESLGLYFEEDRSAPRLHIQIVPPKSKKRWFLK